MRQIANKKLIATIAMSYVLISCSGSGSGTVNVDGSIISGGASLAVTNVYPSAELSSFSTPAAASRYYVKGLDASIKGTCSRGVAAIKVNEGGPDYTETATCLNDGSFVWSKTYLTGSQGDKTLTLTAYDSANAAIAGLTATVNVRIDNTAPAAPTLVSPASNPYTHGSVTGAFTFQLLPASDAVRMTGPAAALLSFVNPNYEYPTTFIDGTTTVFTFYAFDLAGNQSAGTSVTVTYTPSLDLKIANSFLGGPVTDSGTNYSMETSIHPVSNRSSDSGTSFSLETGFNYIINWLRAN